MPRKFIKGSGTVKAKPIYHSGYKKIPPTVLIKRAKTKLDDLQREILHALYPNPTCVCCGTTIGWFHPTKNPYGMQVGHYKTSARYSTRWDRDNVYTQCAPCNYKHEQDEWAFTKYLLDTRGQEFIDQLTIKSLKSEKRDLFWYEAKIKAFEDELNSLKPNAD